MSNDDQARAIGEAVQDYVDSKRKLAAMRADLQRASEKYQKAAECLHNAATTENPELISSVALTGLSTESAKLVGDLRSEIYRHADLLTKIKQFGLEG